MLIEVKEGDRTQGVEVFVENIKAHGESCNGCKRHDKYIMLGIQTTEGQFVDVFLDKDQTDCLIKTLNLELDIKDYIGKVAEFHQTFKHPILSTPQIPIKKRSDLRVSLLAEEVDELQEAINAGDIIAVADALADIQYVLSGAVLEFGLQNKFPALFDEVHRPNMSKACESFEEAERTVLSCPDICDIKHYEEHGKWLIFRRSDGKTIKSIGYSPANLKSILEDETI